MKQPLLYLIRLYQQIPSTFLLLNKGSCRFSPTCSEYCYQAIESHGTIKGTWVCMKRVFKCNPLFRGRDDSVVKLT